MKHLQLWTAAMCSAVALLSSPAANAGVMDFLFGSSSKSETAAPQSTPSASHSRNWQLADFTQIQLVEREKSASDNRHPLNVSPEALRDSLASVRIPGGNAGNNTQPLFAADELAQLSEALAEALASAKPQDDVLLLSTSRRNEGFLSPPKAVTARIFATEDGLQLLVRDARFDFFDAWKGTHVPPVFTYSTRSTPSSANLQSVNASNRRADWLSFPLAVTVKPAATALAQPKAIPVSLHAAPLPPAVVVSPAANAAVTSVATTPPTPSKKHDAAFFDEQEERLKALKRLRDKDLISEPEFQQKRKEILQAM